MKPEWNLIAEPVFASILIDCSGSMQAYAVDVIEGHRVLLDVLRRSEKGQRGDIWLQQSLFADNTIVLNDFYQLHPVGPLHDRITVLDANNYRQGGRTALYDAVLVASKGIEAQIQASFRLGLRSSAMILVITSGTDGSSSARPEDVHQAISILRAKECLAASALIAIEDSCHNAMVYGALQRSLGFSQLIVLGKDPRSIRRAFAMSARIVSGRVTHA